jgi:two-component sensor histidine kinase
MKPNIQLAWLLDPVSLHELATNAAKFGSLSENKGRVSLKWVHGADRELILRWTETGGPPVEPPTRKGFGSRVIVGMIEQLSLQRWAGAGWVL